MMSAWEDAPQLKSPCLALLSPSFGSSCSSSMSLLHCQHHRHHHILPPTLLHCHCQDGGRCACSQGEGDAYHAQVLPIIPPQYVQLKEQATLLKTKLF